MREPSMGPSLAKRKRRQVERGERRMGSESILKHSQSLCLMMVIAAFALSASAKSPIYRCIKDGQTVLTDKPCEEEA